MKSLYLLSALRVRAIKSLDPRTSFVPHLVNIVLAFSIGASWWQALLVGLVSFVLGGVWYIVGMHRRNTALMRGLRNSALAKTQSPRTIMDSMIVSMYGNPPPAKTAVPTQAAQIALKELLLDIVSKDEVDKLTAKLNAGPIPYSTHDLALSVALHFYKSPEFIPYLSEAQLFARIKALEWLKERKVVPILVKSFEDSLYKLYKPG
jgi:hypothetical protein